MPVKQLVGNIPENVTYFHSETKKLECYWENEDLQAGWEGQEVTPAFCSDSTNAKTMETGRRWAGGYWDSKKKVKEHNTANKPIKGIKIVSLERRSEGGRAYKVITPDNFFFDIREDVLMETMIESGISAGGVLNGEYIWARVGSEMKLIRVGSVLHNIMVVNTQDRELKKIGYGDLKVGTIYKGKSADRFVFLGYVNYIDCEYDENVDRYQRLPPVLSRTMVHNGLLLWKYSEDDTFGKKYFSCWDADLKTTHSFIKECGTVEIPKGLFEKIKKEAILSMKRSVDDRKQWKISEDGVSYFACYSDLITMLPNNVEFGVEPEFSIMVEKFPLTNTITKKVK